MFTTVSMSGFRCFEDLTVADLGRVNLVVGENGAGKTSFLEGVQLLRARGNPLTLLSSALARGEYESEENEDGAYERGAELRFAFHGRGVGERPRFRIEGRGDEADRTITGEVVVLSADETDAPTSGAPSRDSDDDEWIVFAAATPNKLLLVDDIDAGLHHRAMGHMWATVIDTARRRGLQVFATTHSIDCITALRRACIDAPDRSGEIRVVRLVKGGRAGITFTADELDTAIEGEVEVRG